MTVTITQQDIASTLRKRDGKVCPVFRAMRRVSSRVTHVTMIGVRVDGEQSLLGSVMLPESVKAWIRDLDDGEAVKPITFEIELCQSKNHP